MNSALEQVKPKDDSLNENANMESTVLMQKMREPLVQWTPKLDNDSGNI
jgi:hypothetical protein